jgi:two-component system, OmpR family, sensor histidine kinase KdpD
MLIGHNGLLERMPRFRISKLLLPRPELGARFEMACLHISGALALIAAVTFLSTRMIPLSASTAGLFYLVAVALAARLWGIGGGASASVAALLCFHYFFLPPVGHFTISQPAGIEAALGFLIAAAAVTLLARRPGEAEDSIDRQKEMEGLYALSRAILLTDPGRPVAKQIVYQIAQIFKLPAAVLYDRNTGETFCAGPEDMPGIDDKLREAAVRGTLFHDAQQKTMVTAVRLGGDPIASAALRGAALSDSALHALTNLVAIGLERVRGQEAARRAELARQSQELKSTLLDAIAHEFKAPLTSIKAATTALASGSVTEPLQQHVMISIVDEEADRLSRLVTDAIQMAHVEGTRTDQIARELHPVCALVDTALAPIKPSLEGRQLFVHLQEDLPLVLVDPDLVGLAIRQLVDNALKYALPNTPITISGRTAEGKAFICVSDRGPGIHQQGHARIFDKFYRSPSNRGYAAGTGMGLAIAQKILEVHCGEIRVQSSPGEGTEFVIALPAASEEIPARVT